MVRFAADWDAKDRVLRAAQSNIVQQELITRHRPVTPGFLKWYSMAVE